MASDHAFRVLTIQTSGEMDARAAERAPVVALNPKGSKQPLIVLRTWKGEVPFYQRLACHLGPGQPIFAIAPPRGQTRAEFPSRVAQWTEFFLPTLRRVQSGGPYRLGGWSFGGLVALSVAEQLKAADEVVDLIAMFDTRHPKNQAWTTRSLPHEIVYRLNELLELAPGDRGAYCRLQCARLWRRERNKLRKALEARKLVSSAQTEPRRPMSLLMRSVRTSFIRYKAARSNLPVALFWTEESRDREGECLLGWSRYLHGPLQSNPVPGAHHTLFDEPNVAVLARQLRTALQNRAAEDLDSAA